VGGAELQLALLANALSRVGFPVTFGVGGYKGVSDSRTPEGIQVRTLYAMKRRPSVLRKLIRPIEMLRALGSIPADIYIIQGAGAQAGVLAAYCKATRSRFVFWLASDTDATCHIPGLSRTPRSERWLAALALRWADVVVAQTQRQKQLVREHVGREAVVIPNIWPLGVGITEPGDEPYALWVSNIRPEKRPEMLLEVAQRLPHIRFVMIGGPVRGQEGLYSEVRTRAAQTSNVDFIGYVPFEQIDPYFADAAIMVNTSAVEGFPNTYLQAWAAGKPVVGSFDPDGLIERYGLGVTFADAQQGSARLDELWSSERRVREMGDRAIQYVRKHHSEGMIVSRLEALLLGLSA